MRRWLLAAAADATAEDFDGGGEADSRAGAGAAADAGGAAADLQSDLMVTAQDDMLHEQHTAVHAFHHHIPHREQGSSGTGIIWLLVLLHAFFLGYWAWIWWRQRLQREVAARKTSALPQKVNCVYDWTPVIPQMSNMQLINKSAQH